VDKQENVKLILSSTLAQFDSNTSSRKIDLISHTKQQARVLFSLLFMVNAILIFQKSHEEIDDDYFDFFFMPPPIANLIALPGRFFDNDMPYCDKKNWQT
tara:strand:+ start:173 stop:472 length:300 start_codon:yes stop_codon:yes gene_type:complete